jgi:hypothetical protein
MLLASARSMVSGDAKGMSITCFPEPGTGTLFGNRALADVTR